ncbi:MAG: type II CRISPR RNA-guided endonuclease Cas9 [Staphylococcus epidermidis]|nr:type II CRISPR RNA-guided endonuclease Cas9 [Staphylococcus epidermidis]
MKYILGLDVGIASIGYSIMRLDENNNPDKIILLNSVVFPIAENEKGKSYASKRGELRRSRRINRRRKFRKERIKKLFINNGLMTNKEASESLNDSESVYKIRVKGLDEKLTNSELFKILYWFGGHRGFKSNRKSELKDSKVGILIESLKETKEQMLSLGYRTVGELYLNDEHFKDHKRNKFYDDGYIGSSYRNLIVDEVEQILSCQLKHNEDINEDFKDKYINILTSQRNFDEGPGNNSPYAGSQISKMIGHDSFVRDRIRGSKSSFTFNYFDLLSKVNNIRVKISINDDYRLLTDEERLIVVKKALEMNKTKFNQVKKWLYLPSDAEFNLVNYEKNNAESNTQLCDFSDVNHIKKCLSKELADDTDVIDKIAEILSTYKSDNIRRDKLVDNVNNIQEDSIDKLLELNFSKFGKLSIKTMKEIIPYLENGSGYDKAAEEAGYDFNKVVIDKEYIDENVTNAVVKRSVMKTIKLVEKIVKKYGNPYEIHIELAREMGKSQKERKEIEQNQLNNREKNEAIANEIEEMGFPVNGQSILKMKLYKEQVGIDPYTKNSSLIDISKALSGNDYYEIDHIIPYSKSFDDSYSNKVLVSKKANQQKGDRIPMEYLSGDNESIEWLTIFAIKLTNKKKRDFLLKNTLTDDDVKGWRQRNINDTRYINKLLSNYLNQNINFNKEDNKKHVYTLNGSVTAKIRSRWGITKNRMAGDLHHAIDATVIACVTDSFVQKVTRYSKNNENRFNRDSINENSKESQKTFNDFPLPYKQFREEIIDRTSDNPKELMMVKNWNGKYTEEEIKNIKPIITVRFPEKKVSGAVHMETVNSAKYIDKGIISQKVTVNDLKIKDEKILSGVYQYKLRKDNGNKLVFNLLYEKLSERDRLKEILKKCSRKDKKERERINQEISKVFPENALFYESNGHKNKIRKFRVYKNSDKGVLLNNGNAISDNAKNSMFRVDLFNSNGKKLLVPVYKSDYSKKVLPMKVISNGEKEIYITDEDEFLFSLYRNDLIYVNFGKGKRVSGIDHEIKEIFGYFKSCDSSTGSISIDNYDNSFSVRGIGVSKLPQIEKYQIDIFGNYHLVNEKKRQEFD